MSGVSFSLDLSRLQAGDKAPSKEDIVDSDLVIIGAGPAGLTAGLYAGRALLNPIIMVGKAFGGQAAATSEMENYPGFPEGVGGMALTEQMAAQAARFGAETIYEEVTGVDLGVYPFILKTYGPTYCVKALIICTGASPRRLNVPGETKFYGRGVSFCATCDAYFYRDKTVVVLGGGDSAVDESLFLTRFAREVIIVHRRDQLRASPILQRRAQENPKIRFVWDTVVDEILGENSVTGVRVHNVKTGEESVIPSDGVFVYVGLIPSTRLFEGQLALDENGYIITDKQQRTSVPGVFAAGDVQDPWFRQTVVAAGAGAAAAIEAQRFLAERAYQAQEALQQAQHKGA
jgi:thioredoxin reductase (NADPH)